MAICTLEFDLSSYWHIGSGTGTDAVADAVIVRDADELPIIPGRTVKGLLRDAMRMATLSGRVNPKSVEKWFGTNLAGYDDGSPDSDAQQERLEEGRFNTEEARLWFGSATMPKAWSDWARTHPDSRNEVLQALVTHVASTAIDEKGVAAEHSLRVTEVAVPMKLKAEVRGPDDDRSWIDDLRQAVPLLRALGSRRSRGFGRVDVKLEVRN